MAQYSAVIQLVICFKSFFDGAGDDAEIAAVVDVVLAIVLVDIQEVEQFKNIACGSTYAESNLGAALADKGAICYGIHAADNAVIEGRALDGIDDFLCATLWNCQRDVARVVFFIKLAVSVGLDDVDLC